MPTIQLSTNSKNWFKGCSTDITAATTAPEAQTADPLSRNGCVSVQDANLCKLLFYGRMDGSPAPSAENKLLTGTIIYGWSKMGGTTDLWIPTLIGQYNVTLGSSVGVDATPVTAADYFADTVILVDGDESTRIISGIGDEIASLTCDLEGASRIEVGFSSLASGPENANFLYSTF